MPQNRLYKSKAHTALFQDSLSYSQTDRAQNTSPNVYSKSYINTISEQQNRKAINSYFQTNSGLDIQTADTTQHSNSGQGCKSNHVTSSGKQITQRNNRANGFQSAPYFNENSCARNSRKLDYKEIDRQFNRIKVEYKFKELSLDLSQETRI